MTSPAPPLSVAATPATIAAPEKMRLGAYELLIELASGGMATVSLARATDHRAAPPLVAIKRPHRHLANDKTFLTMLVDEARLASAIEHPNVVKVRELGFDGGVPFIVMDYVEGASLAELRRELSGIGRALDARVATRIALDALAGLHAAHELKDDEGRALHIVHRDVSPHNVLLACDGRAHLTDFGIAKAEDRIQTTRTHEVKGKLAYLAPERVDRRRLCTAQSDVFSMAVVLWECFAGRRLFRGEEAVDVLQEVMTGYIPTLAEIGAQLPRALDDVISRALSRDLEVRYATAADFARAIQSAVGPDQIGTHLDVARLMEAIFGARMAARQEQVREAIGSADLADLLRDSGLQAREPIASEGLPTGQLLAELAPPAPTERYALADGVPRRARARSRRAAWWTAGGVAAGIAIGAVLTLVIVSRRARPSPIVVHGTALPQPSATELPAVTWSRAEAESRVDVEPPEPPEATPGSDPRHDGQRPRVRPPRPIGTVHNGFTKLR